MAKTTPPKDPETGKFVKAEPELDYKDIKNKSFDEIAVTPTPEEPAVEEPTPETPDENEIEFDPAKFKEEVVSEVSTKVSQETADKIAKTLTGKDTATEAQKDKYEAYAEKFMAEKGREPTWFEVAKFIKEEAIQELKDSQAEEKRILEEQQNGQQEIEKARTEAFNKYIDEQLDDLHKSGKINKDDPEQRKALFTAMMKTNQDRVAKGQQPIYSIKEIFYEHFTPPPYRVAGADAPISAGNRSGHTDNEPEINYADVHKKSFLDLITGR